MIYFYKKMLINTFVVLSLVSFGACSEKTSSKNNASTSLDQGVVEPGTQEFPRTTLEEAARGAEGFYDAKLDLINADVSEGLTGPVTLKVHGDHLKINVKLAGLEEFSAHAQYIQTASQCPTLADDQNSDGFVDSIETETVAGKILIPVDGDLSAQMLDYNVFPAANGAGKYFYVNSTSLALMLSDLLVEDSNPDDAFAKLHPGESLNLDGRVFVIYGAPSSLRLPTTVHTFNGLSRNASLPIACGVIKRAVEESSESN